METSLQTHASLSSQIMSVREFREQKTRKKSTLNDIGNGIISQEAQLQKIK